MNSTKVLVEKLDMVIDAFEKFVHELKEVKREVVKTNTPEFAKRKLSEAADLVEDALENIEKLGRQIDDGERWRP